MLLTVKCTIVLCQLHLICASNGISVVNSNESRLPSLYEQYCCVDDNRGKSIILTSDHKETYFLCPLEIPPSCNTVFPSCSSILISHPTATSGYYTITLANGTMITEYCDMEGVNCDGEGGWMRVGYLNMSDPSENCPPGFSLYEVNGIRACGSMKTGCNSAVKFSTNNIAYSQVCGRVTGYQKGAPDAIYQYAGYNDINQPYVDGVSITRGNPRQHIWTFMAAIQENFVYNSGHLCCPCAPNSPVTLPAFIGNDYFCESGCPGIWDLTTFHSNDPLWDGKQCGLIEKDCCNAAGIPWFNKVLDKPTTDDIELRVCIDQSPTGNEDSPVSYYEIYVK